MTWTDQRIADLRRLWSDGMSTSRIGRQLDVTKNSVVGKARRLGLPARQSPIKVKKVAATPKVVEIRSAPFQACRWPFGDPGTEAFRFCGAPAIANKPYCAEHCAQAYVRSDSSRASRAA